MEITPVTRRDIMDALTAERISWSGRLDEPAFLARLFDLGSIPSNDKRFGDASGDIWKHRVINSDWDDDWVFTDRRFNLLGSDDEVFLRFLCETVHPVVRSDPTEVDRLVQMYNQHLANDGFQIVERTRLSGRPVYVGRYLGVIAVPGVAAARETFSSTDLGYIAQQITRMDASVVNDPELAIGTAKELVESCCQTILAERGIAIPKAPEIGELVKLASKALELTPEDIPDKAKAAKTIKRLLSNLATITQGVAELRNSYGTGHGRAAMAKGLQPRHAKLAVGAASTLAVFLAETHNERRTQ
jgi:hypothetical protein